MVSPSAARSHLLALSVRPGAPATSDEAATAGTLPFLVGTSLLAAAVDGNRQAAKAVSRRMRRKKRVFMTPNVRAKPTAEADAGWPRKDNLHDGLGRPDGGRRSGSAP